MKNSLCAFLRYTEYTQKISYKSVFYNHFFTMYLNRLLVSTYISQLSKEWFLEFHPYKHVKLRQEILSIKFPMFPINKHLT